MAKSFAVMPCRAATATNSSKGSQRIKVLLPASGLVYLVRASLTRLVTNWLSSLGCCSRIWTSGSVGC